MISDNIRNYRKGNNMSQDELAEKLGVSRQSISLWETGQTQPTIDNIIALAKIFNVSSDKILGDTDTASDSITDLHNNENINDSQRTSVRKKKKLPIIITIVVVAVIIVGVILYAIFGNTDSNNNNSDSGSENNSVSQTEIVTVDEGAGEYESEIAGDNTPAGNNTVQASVVPEITQPAVPETTQATVPMTTQAVEVFDLFSYCKDFAINIGTLNGDYCIYQQSAALYGGSPNEYFSLSYWGDSNMVEFCIHCPLDDTYSINFYLRMRGGYNKQYEYLTSLYYRDTGESVRYATGYIDPAVFSENYPLSCDEYWGSTDAQNSFMEESRIGICDLICCLKEFVKVEKMDCDFSDFEFVNF